MSTCFLYFKTAINLLTLTILTYSVSSSKSHEIKFIMLRLVNLPQTKMDKFGYFRRLEFRIYFVEFASIGFWLYLVHIFWFSFIVSSLYIWLLIYHIQLFYHIIGYFGSNLCHLLGHPSYIGQALFIVYQNLEFCNFLDYKF